MGGKYKKTDGNINVYDIFMLILLTAYPQKASDVFITFAACNQKTNPQRIFKNFLLGFQMKMHVGVIL